ncbi:MAG: glycosyltransferase [Chitinophagales bacterium]|nr:glycosyltransferase [Chitinophagales bacterium]
MRSSANPQLSVVIVNYNVKYFLEHALYSVRKASRTLHVEVFVVDNNSSDGSNEMLLKNFPEVNLIANNDNLGFAKANNQAIKKANGEFVLLLNPDTVVQEDTFEKCLSFMKEHPEAGALGVKMVDGSGKFLPESKRALPTPGVALFKLSGLSSLFPKSRIFGKYHLGYLDESKTHEVDVLAGAFMMIRKSVLDSAGLLDEDFFMYGEDVDLSYRIKLAGFKNYYYPETRIIHYKGESTKKGSLNYVRMFFNAMAIFADKHYSSGTARFYHFIIQIAIILSAALTLIRSSVKRLSLFLADAALAYIGIYLIQDYWGSNFKDVATYYPDEFTNIVIPVYIAIWLASSFFSGAYDKPYRIIPVIRGVLFGTLLVAAAYGFFPEDFRFSRAIIVLGAIWMCVAMIFDRMIYNSIKFKRFVIEYLRKPRIAIIGNAEEAERTIKLSQESGLASKIIGHILPDGEDPKALGNTHQLMQLIRVYQINEIIFCAKDVGSKQIIDWMSNLGSRINYKILPESGFSIIGSHSKNTSGEIHAVELNLAIDKSSNRRNKRVLDVMFAIVLMIFFVPALLFSRSRKLLKNSPAVLFGKKTWVGYAESLLNTYKLPTISKPVITVLPKDHKELSPETIDRINLMYAKEYQVENDIRFIYLFLISK